MTDEQIQKKLNQLTRIANELGREAKRRYGREGTLFFEADGGFHIMDGDEDHGLSARQKHIRFSSDGHCTMGAGAW